ncbi:hypothetical protein [Cumulibacter soli]|uniref:hypothetical protein n=1 Tax=Cumulibacter soli TaxID=2546344 RepID=UPI0010682E33|nr:hypothetical protein [Cumulibacter soli]
MDSESTRDAAAGFARIYAVLGAILALMCFQPLYHRFEEIGGHSVARTFPGLWDELTVKGSPIATAVLLLAFVLGLLLLVAAFGVSAIAVPIMIGAGWLAVLVLLTARPTYPDRTYLSPWGESAVAVSIFGVLIAAAHVWGLVKSRQRK